MFSLEYRKYQLHQYFSQLVENLDYFLYNFRVHLSAGVPAQIRVFLKLAAGFAIRDLFVLFPS